MKPTSLVKKSANDGVDELREEIKKSDITDRNGVVHLEYLRIWVLANVTLENGTQHGS
jgi:hypothetical protein